MRQGFDPKMTVEKLVSHPVRFAVLKSILSRENASVFREIRADIPQTTNNALLYFHLAILAKYQVMYKCENYITNRGSFYSIYWSDEAEKAVALVEEQTNG